MASRRFRALTITAIAVGVVLAAIGGLVFYVYVTYVDVDRYTATGSAITIKADNLPKVGNVLVTDNDFALYMFPPDAQHSVTCTGNCAGNWPPLVVPPGKRLVAGDGVRSDLLGTVKAPNGDRVATYDGWPLYTFVGDPDPGKAAGQGVNADGGLWWVMRPSGAIVKTGGKDA